MILLCKIGDKKKCDPELGTLSSGCDLSKDIKETNIARKCSEETYKQDTGNIFSQILDGTASYRGHLVTPGESFGL